MASAIEKLGYRVVKGAEKYQFVKPGPGGGMAGNLKIDLLTGPQTVFSGTKVKADKRRAKPTPSIGLHAHPVDEATTLEDGLLSIILEDSIESGEIWKAEVFIPHPYTFLMMKLFAFRDRRNDPEKDHGRHHALDLYTILATSTEIEWNQALEFRDKMLNTPNSEESARIVSEYFSAPNQLGIIRIQESPYFRPELQVGEFISALGELFGTINHSD